MAATGVYLKTMKDPFAKDLAIDSPTRESFNNVDGCYNKNIFKTGSFANSRRALQSGADKISRTFRSVRNTFGNLSQVCILSMFYSGFVFLINFLLGL